MLKIFEKIRTSIFGERDAIELGKLTLKNKKLTDNQKLTQILTDYGKYYKYKHADAVDLMTWELHYEDFMIDEKTKHQLRFERFYKACDEQINYANTVCLVRQLSSLKALNYTKCTPGEIDILRSAKLLTKTYNEEFDYEGFYTKVSVRDSVSEKNESMVDKLLANYESIEKANQAKDQGAEK